LEIVVTGQVTGLSEDDAGKRRIDDASGRFRKSLACVSPQHLLPQRMAG
jgi:hypothetical protein